MCVSIHTHAHIDVLNVKGKRGNGFERDQGVAHMGGFGRKKGKGKIIL